MQILIQIQGQLSDDVIGQNFKDIIFSDMKNFISINKLQSFMHEKISL